MSDDEISTYVGYKGIQFIRKILVWKNSKC